jgi:hypothetical protein
MPDEKLIPLPCLVCDGTDWDLERDKDTGEISAICRGCNAVLPLYDDDDQCDAHNEGVQWAENLARDIAQALDGLDRPDASEWAERLHWFANRARGGQLSIHADAELRARFGLPADYLADNQPKDPE